MIMYALSSASVAFLDVALRLTIDQWRDYLVHARALRPSRREVARQISASLSVIERSTFERSTRDHIVGALWEVIDPLDSRDSTLVSIDVDRTVFALQKRDKLGMDALRVWFAPFEEVDVHLDDLLHRGSAQ